MSHFSFFLSLFSLDLQFQNPQNPFCHTIIVGLPQGRTPNMHLQGNAFKKIDLGPHPGKQGAREAPGLPSGGKMTPKIEEKPVKPDAKDLQKKASIPLCFSIGCL